MHQFSAAPPPQGLYDGAHEHDACGVAFVADLTGKPTRATVDRGLAVLCNLEHRGAKGAEPDTGDGAGILTQIPDAFLRAVVDFELPEAGGYAVGTAFLPTDESARGAAIAEVERIVAEEGLRVLGWRDVPIDLTGIGNSARSVMPVFRQLFVAAAADGARIIG